MIPAFEYCPVTGYLRRPGGKWLTATNSTGYIYVRSAGKVRKAHRVVWEMHNGPIPGGMDVDHINGNRADNRLENLRLACRGANLANTPLRARNTSGFKGVVQYGKRFAAQFRAANLTQNLGRYATAEEAARVYDLHASEWFGPHAQTNASMGLI